ncbi:MAG: sugar ABC transporter substrate-binding protein [Caldilineaceae bacterium]|nr:sugar ABC transporter substrate-binding protein [Caldilineaceae bacterium]
MSVDRKLSRRHFMIGSLAVTGAVALAACAPAAAPSTSSEGGESAMAEEITLLFHSRLGTHADWHISRIPLFEETYPGLKLEIDELPGAEMYSKVYALAASGTVGDVVWTYLNNPPEHKAKGVMIPLDDIVESKGFDLSQFWPALLAAVTLEGQLHAVPNHGHFGTTAYYHNKTLLEESGAALPNPDWTTADLTAAGLAVTKAPEIWGMRAQGGGQEHIPSYLRTFGGDLLNEDGTRCLLTEEGSVAALKWLYDLMKTEEVDPCLCGDDINENFLAGKVGIHNTTTGLVGQYANLTNNGEMGFDWGVTVGPVGPNGDRGSQVSAAAFCITGNSDHPNEAFNILDFYSTKEDGIEHVKFGAGSPGGRIDVWESDELNEIDPIFRLHSEIYPEGPKGWFRPANARTSEFIDTLNNNLQAIWTDVVGFDEGVEQTYTLCQEVLDKEPL